MAALQSRARAQHQQQYGEQVEQQEDHGKVSHHGAGERAGGQSAASEDAWVLFAPQQHPSPSSDAPHAGNRAIAHNPAEVAVDTEDPFEQAEDNDSTMPASATAWQLVSSASSPSSPSAPQAELSATRSPRAASSGYKEHLSQDSEGDEDDDDGLEQDSTANSNSRWSAVPKPRRDGSSFFDDEDEEEALFSDKLLHDRRHDGLFSHGGGNTPVPQFIYPQVPAHRSPSTSRHRREDGEDTDMLSLPSSLSVSDRSASDDLPSPRFDYVDSAFTLPADDSQEAGNSNITLTEAALSRIGTGHIPAQDQAEIALTSGSEDEAEDADEKLLSRAPDAISAGIRPNRRRALQSIRSPSQLSSALSGGKVSSSQRSATKRRHRQSGISDKGSKRSNTSANLLKAQGAVPSLPSSKGKERKSVDSPAQPDRHVSPSRGRAARFTQAARQAARDIFSVDEEVMNMMAQPGSVFSQARPHNQYSQRKFSDRALHGLSAFSAHMASELGDSPGLQGYLNSMYSDEQSLGSGDETETEREAYHPTTRRARRRSSLFADDRPSRQDFVQGLHSPSQQDSLAASLTPEQLHTASLGLHRSFSLAGLQHFLIDSVYNSLSSSMLGTPRSPSSNLSASHLASSSIVSARKRTHSAPSVERSHSSSDLYGQASNVEEQAEIQEYREAVSYWRRVLRSFAF